MRIKTYARGGYTDGGFTSGGGTMTGPLILAGDPTKELEAVTKQYVDAKLLSFDGSKFTAGTLQVGRLPAFAGDVTSTTGTNDISLIVSGVAPGVYSKVTVNNKGLITGGGSITETDLPDLDWNKITSDKPTTLAGYGITNGLSKTGGTITGTLTMPGNPTTAYHAATKQYIDNNTANFSALRTGDIISKMTNVTPEGFLKCNGGDLSKTMYPALYEAVGEVFTSYSQTYVGGGQPWQQQYDFNTTQKDVIGNWSWNGGTLPSTLNYQGSVIVTKNRVYMTNVYVDEHFFTAAINADGTLGAWSTVTFPLAYEHQNSVAAIIKNRVYLFSGNGTGVSMAPVNADGTIGTFVSVNPMVVTGNGGSVVVTKNRVYMLGCQGSSTNRNTMYAQSAVINSDGTLGAWSLSTQNSPGYVTISKAVIIKNRVYMVGGYNSAQLTNNVIFAYINADGTIGPEWISAPSLPNSAGLGGMNVFVSQNRLYVLGAVSGSAGVGLTWSVPINADGSLGAWVTGTPLPLKLGSGAVFATSTRLYYAGGQYYDSANDTFGFSDRVYSVSLTGGLNDYSSFNDGVSMLPTDIDKFRLPNLSTTDLPGSTSYIKL